LYTGILHRIFTGAIHRTNFPGRILWRYCYRKFHLVAPGIYTDLGAVGLIQLSTGMAQGFLSCGRTQGSFLACDFPEDFPVLPPENQRIMGSCDAQETTQGST